MFRFGEETGASTPDIVRAYLVAREVFDLPASGAQVEALDNKVDTSTQLAMLLEARKLAERGTRWLLGNRRPPLDLASTVSFFAKGVNGLLPAPAQAAGRARPGRLRGAPRLLHRPGRARRAGRAGRRDGARLLHVRPGGDRLAAPAGR